jgi:hypothetical protein
MRSKLCQGIRRVRPGATHPQSTYFSRDSVLITDQSIEVLPDDDQVRAARAWIEFRSLVCLLSVCGAHTRSSVKRPLKVRSARHV